LEEASPSRVRVKLNVGEVTVEVECGVDEVGSVVGRVIDALAERGVAKSGATSGSPIVGDQAINALGGRRETCKGIILTLWREGWFAVGRGLGEVHGEMGRQGYHYDRTAVAHALVDLVREGILTRVGRPRRYSYVQKRPPTAISESESLRED
jgi:hypothetical protein